MLFTFAMASQAEPISLEAVCHVTSAVPGQGKCQLNYILSDDLFGGTPTTARKSQIKVDGVLVGQYVNDSANPTQYSVPNVSGFIEVTCGASHTVAAYVAEPLVAGYQKVGSLPPVVCPAAP